MELIILFHPHFLGHFMSLRWSVAHLVLQLFSYVAVFHSRPKALWRPGSISLVFIFLVLNTMSSTNEIVNKYWLTRVYLKEIKWLSYSCMSPNFQAHGLSRIPSWFVLLNFYSPQSRGLRKMFIVIWSLRDWVLTLEIIRKRFKQ